VTVKSIEDLLAVLGVGFVSALVPLVNIEAYLGVRGSVAGMQNIWLLGFAAALGQMLGKLIWYSLGASSLRWHWIRRRVETPKARARLEKWRGRTVERPVVAGALVLLSATVGFPPLAILAVLAGQLRMNLAMFFTLGLVGRWVRFCALLGGADSFRHLLH
jgi:membrane protein YqaA with SNARE-associated domain